MISIEQVVEQIPDWAGRSVVVKPLGGGLTNAIYRVEVDDVPYVVRVPGASTELLEIDRDNEHHTCARQPRASVRVAYFLADANVTVLEFIRGETMTIPLLHRPHMPTRMAQALKQLHSGPRFLRDFNMFRLIEQYFRIVQQRNIRIPDGYRDCLPEVAEIEAALLRRPMPTVPCHNDLLAGNYLDDGKKLWLIDFEYSGNNDPTFELGNTCQEQRFDDARITEMCTVYFGEASLALLARMKLNMVLSNIGWTLWGSIQASISAIEFDFWGWALERWARAKARMDTAEYRQWLRILER
ncbi:MAG: phosphotransferase [Gemmataceae bacterium]